MIQVRRAIPGDRAELVSLFVAFFREDGIVAETAATEANLARVMASPAAQIWAAEENGVLVGLSSATSTVGVEFGCAVEIEDLYVAPSHRGQGLSRRLLRVAMDWASEVGANEVFLVITPEAQAEQNLVTYYEKYGFTRSGRIVMFRENADSAF